MLDLRDEVGCVELGRRLPECVRTTDEYPHARRTRLDVAADRRAGRARRVGNERADGDTWIARTARCRRWAGHLDQPDVVMGEWDCRRNIDVGDHFVRSRSADDREDLPYPVVPVKVLVLKSHRRNLWANDINVSAPAVPAPIVNSAAGVAITIAAAAITKLVSWRIVSRPICFLLPTTGPNRIMDSRAPRRCATAALHARQNIAAHPVDPTGRAHVDLMDLTVLTTV